MPRRSPCALLLAATLLASGAVVAAGQSLPQLAAPEGCRSELEARLAFGLCPDSTFDFYATGEYRTDVPRPEEVLGYPVGSWHTTYGRMERFIDTLARAVPERVRIFPYGQSVERQTLYLLAISNEQTIQRLEEIRSDLQRLADPRRTSTAEAHALIARLPVVVWLNSANDGNESAAFEAAMQLAYQLAAGEDARTRAMREGALVLINMAHNPESHQRHVAWYNAFVMGDADPRAMEHRPPWGLSTNNNHYQVDLNRDALGQTQTETRAVTAELQRWRPQVFVDLHGQTTQYYFPPAADPINPVYPPQAERWFEVFGRGNAAAFDQHGWSYYTRDIFDHFYPGYWDTYPTLHGATGMTYETDGGGTRGVRWRRDDGTILTFADGIARHFVASLATIETAVQNREARLRDYHDYFASAIAEGRRGPLRTVVLLPGNDPDRAARLATTLLRHGIEVRRVIRAANVSGTDYLNEQRTRREVPVGAYVIDLAQPNGRLVRTLLAPDIPLPQRFLDQELARLARNLRRAEGEREGDAFYDITAWNLALAAGVPAFWSGDSPALAAEPLALSSGTEKSPGGWQGEVAWPRAGGVAGRARSAYVWAPGSVGATRLLSRLLDEGFNVAVVERPMVVGDTAFPRGSYIARVERNRPELHERMDALAREAGVAVHVAATAFPERGATGIGSEVTRTLRAPRLAVVAGEGVDTESYGTLWFYLERRIGKPFTALRSDDVPMISLEDFDVLILPDGRGYERRLGEMGAQRLREWAERGGTLIGYAGGAAYLMEQGIGTHAEPDTTAPPPDTIMAILRAIDTRAPQDLQLPIASPEARPDLPLAVPGAFLRGWLDLTHWLTFGYEQDELPLLAQSLPLRASTAGANPVIYATGEDLRLSGFVWPDNTERHYAARPYATVDTVGSGRVILFAEDPIFRAVFDAPGQLLMNAIFLGARGR